MISVRRTDVGDAARRWVTLTGQRKDLLYHAAERNRIAVELVRQAFEAEMTPRIILFHERVDEATMLYRQLSTMLDVPVVLEHSKIGSVGRRRALDQFAAGVAPVLVSVKSLVEGIDVPAADTGISVASTASVRQRVQALGRVLRRAVDSANKRSVMHLIYVHGTVDDLIYGKADWTDMTGESANVYWRWTLDAATPEPLPGPPRRPVPTENDAWDRIRGVMSQSLNGVLMVEQPVEWPGEVVGQEYSVTQSGVVHNAFGGLIANPQGVADMLRIVGRHGGRFRVTPSITSSSCGSGAPTGRSHRFRGWSADSASRSGLWSKSRVSLRHSIRPTSSPVGRIRARVTSGAASFVVSRRGGGQVERVVKGGREFASASGETPGARNARQVIDAWDRLRRPTSKFFVNELGHAWYESVGSRRFLADVRGGFDWPDDEQETAR